MTIGLDLTCHCDLEPNRVQQTNNAGQVGYLSESFNQLQDLQESKEDQNLQSLHV